MSIVVLTMIFSFLIPAYAQPTNVQAETTLPVSAPAKSEQKEGHSCDSSGPHGKGSMGHGSMGGGPAMNATGPTFQEVKIDSLKFGSHKHMLFGKQPNKEQWKSLKEAGVELVINVDRVQSSASEPQDVEAAGMSYLYVPIQTSSGDIDATAILRLERVHRDTHGKKQVVFSSDGSLAYAWWVAHKIVKHQLSPEQAIADVKPMISLKADLADSLKRFSEAIQ